MSSNNSSAFSRAPCHTYTERRPVTMLTQAARPCSTCASAIASAVLASGQVVSTRKWGSLMAGEFNRSGPEALFLVVVALPRYLGRHECVASTVVIAASAAPPGYLRAGDGRGHDRGVADRRFGGGDGRARLGADTRAGRPDLAARGRGPAARPVAAVELLEGVVVLIGGVFFLV